jgi:hypothetical protein
MSAMVVLTPSFAGDFELCADLNRSVLRYAPSDVRHHIFVSPADMPLFARLAGERTTILRKDSVLPGSFRWLPLVRSAAMVNLRRPFPPVRGWIVQQLVKLAASAAADAEVVLLVDSDVEFVRPFSSRDFVRDGVVRFYRKPHEVDERLPRHMLWHHGARALLGLPPPPPTLLPDYVTALIAWDPAVVRRLLARVEEVTGRRWTDALAAQLHFSEYTLYGVYLDSLDADPAASNIGETSLCHEWYGTEPLQESGIKGFVDAIRPDDVACMIGSKSNTPYAVRQAALAALRPSAPDNPPLADNTL